MARFIRFQHLVFGASRDGDGTNVVAVLIVQDEEITFATDGRDGHRSSLVVVYLASNWFICGVDVAFVCNGKSGSRWHL